MKHPFYHRQRGANAPLTGSGGKKPGQKGYLSQLAAEAHAFLTSKGAIDEPLEAWRRAESVRACGRRISEAVNGDFETIEAHFLALMGRTKKALESAFKADTNEERQARFKLAQLCQQRGLAVPELKDASVKQIWAVFFNIKNQPKRKAAKAARPDLHAELAQAVKEERYEAAARIKRAIEKSTASSADGTDDEIPF